MAVTASACSRFTPGFPCEALAQVLPEWAFVLSLKDLVMCEQNSVRMGCQSDCTRFLKSLLAFKPVSLLCMRVVPGSSDTRVKLVVLWHRRLLTS